MRENGKDLDDELEEDDGFKNLSDTKRPIVGHITGGQKFVFNQTISYCQQSQDMHSMICLQDTASKVRSI